MSFLDLIFAVILIWSAYRGFSKGFIIQLSTLAALLLGIFGAIKFSGLTANFLTEHFNINNDYIHIISFAITFVIIVILVHLLARMVEKLLKAVALGFVNRLLGIVFGVAKIAFIISVILVLVNKANRKYNFLPEEEIEKSILYEPLSDFAPMIFPYLQFDDWKDELEKKKEKKKGKEQKGEKFV